VSHVPVGIIAGHAGLVGGYDVQPGASFSQPDSTHVTDARHSTMGPSSSSQASPSGLHAPPSGGADVGHPVHVSVPSSETHCPFASHA
jgi:hypothetical protein